MKTEFDDVEHLLKLDFDDVGELARSLRDDDRRVVLDNVLLVLPNRSDASDRLKLVLFVQTALAFVPDGALAGPLAERAAVELATIIASMADPHEVKRSAITAVALLLIKASGLKKGSTAILRQALTTAAASSDPEAAGFARRIIERQQVPLLVRATG